MTYGQLRIDQGEALIDLQKSELWAKRKAWIEANEPTMTEEDSAKADVLSVLKGARDHHLEILEQSFNDTQHGPSTTQINVQAKIKGPMEGLCQWLADLQKPSSFYAISHFSLKADEDQKSMVCTLQLTRYYKGGS